MNTSRRNYLIPFDRDDRFAEVFGATITAIKHNRDTVSIGDSSRLSRKIAYLAAKEAANEVDTSKMPRLVATQMHEIDSDEVVNRYLDDYNHVYEVLLNGSRTINVPVVHNSYNSEFRHAAIDACRDLGINLNDVEFVSRPNNTHSELGAKI